MGQVSSNLYVYKASAGSGKTFTLAIEYIKLLIENPRNYRHILAVTFTNKATTEMKERILSQLYGIWKQYPSSAPYTNRICEDLHKSIPEVAEAAHAALNCLIHDYSRFRVETIDSFFQSVLRNLARELDLGANLNIELDQESVLNEAVDSMIEKLDHNSKVMSWILDYIQEKIDDDKRWDVAKEIKSFGSKYIFNEEYVNRGKELRQKLKEHPECVDKYRNHLKQMITDADELMQGCADQYYAILEMNGLTIDDIFWGKSGVSGYFKKLKDKNYSADIYGARAQACATDAQAWSKKTSPKRDQIMALAESELMPLLNETERFRPKCETIINSCRLSMDYLNRLRLLNFINEEVQLQNQQANRFLLANTNSLLQDLIEDGDSSFIFEKIGSNIRYIMIDEFQDTSHMQWGNFRILLQEGLSQGYNSLIVGDVKQSIYRWRNGDWGILNSLKEGAPFFHQGIKVKTLDTNRRSEANIIHFNNQFFVRAVEQLNARYREETGVESEKMVQAYEDVQQNSTQETARGLVHISFQEADEEKSYKENVLENLLDTLNHLFNDAHLKDTDIAILLRNNNNITLVADYLNSHLEGHKVVSDEAFILSASHAVNLMVDAARWLDDENDTLSQARLAWAYQTQVLGKEVDMNDLLLRNKVEDALPEAFLLRREELKMMPLYELFEHLFMLLQVNAIPKEDAYLMAFYDRLNEYLSDHSSDLGTFLQFWDDSLCYKKIPSGETDGIRILSIHKSKGLEYHTVLIPFCDWPMESGNLEQIVWCTPHDEPFKDMSLLPIRYSKIMGSSIYSSEYREEKLQMWVDNLNLLYVAFTRACKNLFLWCNVKTKAFSVSNVIADAISDKTADDEEEKKEYSFGELCTLTGKKKAEEPNELLTLPEPVSIQMCSFDHPITFRQSNQSMKFIEEQQDDPSSNRQDYIIQGKLLHRIFSEIGSYKDVEPLLRRMQMEGLFEDQKHSRQIEGIVRRALTHPKAQSWFDGSWRLYNECAILWRNAKGERNNVRPDRVMMKDGEVVVVDFKFGKPNEKYKDQVRDYIDKLSQMGYSSIKGYLWYVYNNTIEEITREEETCRLF